MFTNPGLAPSTSPGPGLVGSVAPGMPQLDPAILNATLTHDEDGGASLDTGSDANDADDVRNTKHDANLAEVLSDHILNAIGAELQEGIDADEESNAEWYSIVEAGLKLLGLKPGERRDAPYKGAPSAPTGITTARGAEP